MQRGVSVEVEGYFLLVVPLVYEEDTNEVVAVVAGVVEGGPSVGRVWVCEKIRVPEHDARDDREIVVNDCPAQADSWVNHCARGAEALSSRGGGWGGSGLGLGEEVGMKMSGGARVLEVAREVAASIVGGVASQV